MTRREWIRLQAWRLLAGVRAEAATLLAVAGAAAIVVGVALVYVPAGWMAAGVALVAGALVMARSEAEPPRRGARS